MSNCRWLTTPVSSGRSTYPPTQNADICTKYPPFKQSQIFYSLVLLPLGFRLVIPKSLKGIVFPHRGNFRYRMGLMDIKMLLNVPQVSSAKFRKTFHEAMNQARNAPGGAEKSTVCFGKISGLSKSLPSTKWVWLIDDKCKRLSHKSENSGSFRKT